MLYPAAGAQRVRITVLHHGFQVDGGGERVTLTLLRALDRTNHDVVLRCVHPPKGILFNEEDAGPRGESREGDGGQPPLEFERVRLSLVPPGGGEGDGPPRAPNLSAEIKSLFAGTDCDLLVVTDGGFAMERTDAPRVILYANSDLSAVSLRISAALVRRPFRTMRLCRARMAIRGRLSLIRDARAVVVPNSKSTSGVYERRLAPSLVGGVVYPPVDLGRFELLRGMPRERRVATTGRFSPEKNHEVAVRVMHAVGARWDAVGNAREEYQKRYLQGLRGMAGPDMRFHVDASESELDEVLGGAGAYLHPRRESFGIAVVEAIAAGCVPVVPDNSAHPETVPFDELRYRTEEEAAETVRGALDGRYDGLLRGLRDHAQTFSEESFQRGMLEAIGRHGP